MACAPGSQDHERSLAMRTNLLEPFRRSRVLRALALVVFAQSALATTLLADEVLLTDSLGRTVRVPTNELHHSLLPTGETGLKYQIPASTKGTKMSDEVRQRLQESREGVTKFQWFPAIQPPLMSYLASQDEYGNTALRPGALIPVVTMEPVLQGTKYWLSEQGLRYLLEQTVTWVNLSDVMQGENNLGFYTFDLKAKWVVFDAPVARSAGWISTQVEVQEGFTSASRSQDAKSNLGTVTNPTGLWSSHEGVRVPELAWQQSLHDGQWVVVAGMVNQGNYFDSNEYAQSGRGQFINSALINSLVMPQPNYNFGVNLQYQPCNDWYALVGASAGNASAGVAPWTDFSWNTWSLLGEFGFAPDDFLGLGPGIYRIQPFLAQANGSSGGGLCFNLQQQLGAHSPFGWFGRFGFGSEDVSNGAAAQIGTGFVLHAPLNHLGVVPKLSNDLLGVGFVWSQPSESSKTVYHENEYVFETFYTMQLSPTLRLQPDLQIVWDPAFNPDSGPATVFQMQLVLAW